MLTGAFIHNNKILRAADKEALLNIDKLTDVTR